jgi:GT2 family glycosyltransferase
MGVSAIRKDVFQEIGGFDEGMTAWGGENIDLGLRAVQIPVFIFIFKYIFTSRPGCAEVVW